MSKGYGAVQRRVLETLERTGACGSTLLLAMAAYGLRGDLGYRSITETQLAAVRRALAGLCKAGLVVAGPRGSNGSRYWRASASTEPFPKSNRLLAREIGVSHVTVCRARAKLDAAAAGDGC